MNPKKKLPEFIREKNPGYIFGCDICQDICPHNLKTPTSQNPEFSELNGVGSYIDANKIKEIKNNPEILFGTPLTRKKVNGLEDNSLSIF